MSNLELFNNKTFGNVRAVNINGEVWFVGKDVVEALKYERTSYSDTIKRYVDEEDMIHLTKSTQPQFEVEFNYKELGQRGGYLVNEFAVISLVLQSPLPQAKSFRRWVTKEVIPSVLKTGKYEVQPTQVLQLNKEQQAVLSIYELAGSDERVMEHVLVIKEANLRRGMAEGKRYLCDNRVITIPKIIDCIKKHYPEQFEGRSEIATVEWTRYLRQAGYLETRHFAKKNGRGMELRWAYQPTPMFYDVFVNQGMAISREIDERGKYEITYTSDVEKFILSDTFRKGFFDYIDMLYPKMETEQDVVV